MDSYIPLLAALVSALALLAGYAYQKRKERQFEIQCTRQDIYTRLIKNLMTKLVLFEQLRRQETDPPTRVTREHLPQLTELIRTKYPELQRAFNEAREIGALMAMYGTDEAIKAYSVFQMQSGEALNPDTQVTPDPAKLILELRISLFRTTVTTRQEVKSLISD